jgi:hypothetical protein
MGLSVECYFSGHHLSLIDDDEAYVLKAVGNMSLPLAYWGKVMDYFLDRLFRIWGEGDILRKSSLYYS